MGIDHPVERRVKVWEGFNVGGEESFLIGSSLPDDAENMGIRDGGWLNWRGEPGLVSDVECRSHDVIKSDA